MENTVDEIKRKLDIVTYLGEFLTLKKAGRNFKANCPFHHEKTASFVISPDRQIWHCFGACQDGGDIFKFLMKMENITFSEALKELAQKTGVQISNIAIEDKAWKQKEKLYEINSLAAQFYNYLLTHHKAGEKALEYIKNRGTNEKILESFQIGYSPSSWDSLYKFLTKKKIDPKDIEKTGLILMSKKGTYFDRFRERLMFPLKDHRGNIVGFSGRILEDSKTEAKYINSPETEIYHKRETLFGLDMTKENIRKENSVVIVEGEFDMLSLFQNGVGNVVAVKGSAVTTEQLKLLKRYTNKLVFALDSDKSGEETVRRTIKEAEALDFEMGVVHPDFGKDPDEAIKKNQIQYKKMVQKPTPVYDFLIDLAQSRYPAIDAFSKKKLADEVIPYLIDIVNPIVKDYYVKKLSSLLEIDQSAIEELLLKKLNKTSTFTPDMPIKKKEENRFEVLQKYILSLLFQDNNPFIFCKDILSIIDPEDFSVPAYKKIYQHFLLYENNIDTKGNFAISSYASTLPSEILPTFDQILLFDTAILQSEEDKEIHKLVYEFKRLSLKKKIKTDMENDENGDLPKLTKMLSDIEKKLQIL